MKYVVIVSDSRDVFQCKEVFGPFGSIADIQEWLSDKYKDHYYIIDIHRINTPT